MVMEGECRKTVADDRTVMFCRDGGVRPADDTTAAAHRRDAVSAAAAAAVVQ